MRWLHINHRGPMWPRVGLFIHTGKSVYDRGVDLVLAYTRPGRVEWQDSYGHQGRTFVARRRYWIRFSVTRRGFSMARGVTPADEEP